MGIKTFVAGSCLVVLAMFAMTEGAVADAIDGDWCFAADGRRLTIEGSDLTTPGGKRMTGDYDRHAFAYVAPAGEKSAGSKVFMVLIDDDTMILKIGAQPMSTGEGETWRRCAAQVS